MGDQFVIVADEVGSDDAMELPIEKDGTVLLSTIQAQFPSAIGLKYKHSSGAWRGVRVEDNVLDAPHDGWGETTFIITESESLKRKSTGEANGHKTKSSRKSHLLDDIIVLGLPYITTEDELKDYFVDKCGELAFHELKKDRSTGKSRGFGFIRFTNEEDAKKAIKGNHTIKGRKLEVKLSKRKDNPMKLFVGRLPVGTTKDDVEVFFEEYGELSDCFVPSPFRGFGFITYAMQDDALKVLHRTHTMKGAQLNVTAAEPREDKGSGRQENFGVSNNSWNPNKSNQSSNYNTSGSRFNDYQQPPAPQKNVAHELKDMLLTLLNK